MPNDCPITLAYWPNELWSAYWPSVVISDSSRATRSVPPKAVGSSPCTTATNSALAVELAK